MSATATPAYGRTEVSCSCGNQFTTASTTTGHLRVEVCSACHPFYTGGRRVPNSGGRVAKFEQRYGTRVRSS